MDGEAGLWTTSGYIGLPPLARVMGVGRQQQQLSFLNCADVCMYVVNKQFELLKFVFQSVYIDLQYDEISLTFTAGSVCL